MSMLPNIELPPSDYPLLLPWPAPGNPGAILQFDDPAAWRAFILSLGIDPLIPQIVRAKFARAQKLYLLAWLDADLIKAGELVALTALELALTDRYGGHYRKRKPSFASLLRHMVDKDGLTDAAIPMVTRCGGTAIGQLTGDTRPTLAERRNGLAHGDLFDGAPVGGLLELVRDLIDYAYRGYLAEARAGGLAA